jgi:hypothetical protein
MSEFDRETVIRRIRGLMEKTVANGCTEAEATAAAQAASNLLNKYQMSLTDIKIKGEECVDFGINTGVKDGGPMNAVCVAIAYFTDTKVRVMYGAGPLKTATHQFFGLETDTIVAGYIYDIIFRAMLYGWEDYRVGYEGYTQLPGSMKGKVKNGYQRGFATRISQKLREMKDAQRKDNIHSSGRDLVVVKGAVVDEEYAKLNLKLKHAKAKNTAVDHAAYYAGLNDAEKLALNPGVNGSQGKSLK